MTIDYRKQRFGHYEVFADGRRIGMVRTALQQGTWRWVVAHEFDSRCRDDNAYRSRSEAALAMVTTETGMPAA